MLHSQQSRSTQLNLWNKNRGFRFHYPNRTFGRCALRVADASGPGHAIALSGAVSSSLSCATPDNVTTAGLGAERDRKIANRGTEYFGEPPD